MLLSAQRQTLYRCGRECWEFFGRFQTGAAMRLLLVEDDAMIGQSVHKGLKRFGWSVDWVRDGRAAELALENEAYDGVVLDLGLPRKDGLDVLRAQRSKGNDV